MTKPVISISRPIQRSKPFTSSASGTKSIRDRLKSLLGTVFNMMTKQIYNSAENLDVNGLREGKVVSISKSGAVVVETMSLYPEDWRVDYYVDYPELPATRYSDDWDKWLFNLREYKPVRTVK